MDAEYIPDPLTASELGLCMARQCDFMDDSAFMEQLLHEAPFYSCASSLDNSYSTSGTTAWSLPPDSIANGNFLQNDLSTSASPMDYQSGITSLDTMAEEVNEPEQRMSPERSANKKGSSPSVAKDLNSVIAQFPEPPAPGPTPKTQDPEQIPRLRCVTSKRRSKYKSTKTSSTISSDEENIQARPAHNKAERNYRRRLNSSFEKLLDMINLVALKNNTAQHDEETRKDLSKGDVLRLARHQLIAMEMENQRLREQLKQTRIGPQRAFSWSGVGPPSC
ncbi:hypothetical protein CC79DRAFT_200046 [Sarocladium strictum]